MRGWRWWPRSRALRKPCLGEALFNISSYICKMRICCVPYRSREVANVSRVLSQLCIRQLGAHGKCRPTHHAEDLLVVVGHALAGFRTCSSLKNKLVPTGGASNFARCRLQRLSQARKCTTSSRPMTRAAIPDTVAREGQWLLRHRLLSRGHGPFYRPAAAGLICTRSCFTFA